MLLTTVYLTMSLVLVDTCSLLLLHPNKNNITAKNKIRELVAIF
ncbi:hypothetical protein XBO1_2420017 [Xenorhabdus bovienii str. oregonense]|uniref:Uncharacterized protein n=1 Tax=Xenorhabdus bovienii str. oregonense TaxID=1398202 RepID=A0A077P8A4_XENBV|nr:hypothetical protein XBO1_2420017 [Xenorhabdus bovienii str. oregonense]